jgi:hypothetical protein
LRVGRRSLSAFPLLGVLGLLAVATFLVLALVTKIALGREALIYYHHEIAVLAVTALAARALGAPVAAHLDAQALGLGAFLACGRLGCLCAGCCHGRPARRGGVVYGPAHAGGVAAHLHAVPLVPVQAIEAAAVCALVIAAAVSSSRPGAAFAAYVSGYAIIRFLLETQRGDTCRPYRRGLSAAQWTSLATAGLVTLLALAGALPDVSVHLALAAALALAAPLVARRPSPGVLDPRHMWELARLLPAPTAGGEVRETSLGVRCSAGVHADVAHYTLSRAGRTLTHEEADALALQILARRHDGAAGDLVARGATYHVLVHGGPGSLKSAVSPRNPRGRGGQPRVAPQLMRRR